MKKFMVLIFAFILTLLIGAQTFAAPANNINLSANNELISQDVASNGFSGSIDFYHPDSNPYQSKNDLQLNLNYGPHGGPGHDRGPGRGPGYGPPPELWVYTLIGVVVVELLTRDEIFDN